MEFFNIEEESEYQITISKPESVEDLSDYFMTHDELKDLIGKSFGMYGTNPRTFVLTNKVTSELEKWAEKLEASGKKTLQIDDEPLLDLLKSNNHISHFIGSKYGRHGDRICYARRYARKKTRPTQSDVRYIWDAMQCAFRDRYGCYPSHIPRYDRHLPMFRAFKKITGWTRVRPYLKNDQVPMKFYRQIWDNPEEFV